MDAPITHPTYQSLNQPLLFLGCPRPVFVAGLAFACVWLLCSGNSLIGELISFGIGFGFWAVGAAVHAIEPRFIGVAHLWFVLWRGEYDAGKRGAR